MLCSCERPLTDGEDECIWCGHLVVMPDPGARPERGTVPASLGKVYVLPNVVHRIAA